MEIKLNIRYTVSNEEYSHEQTKTKGILILHSDRTFKRTKDIAIIIVIPQLK